VGSGVSVARRALVPAQAMAANRNGLAVWQLSPDRGPLDALLLASAAGDCLPVLASCDVLLQLAGRTRSIRALSDGVRWRMTGADEVPGGTRARYACSVGTETTELTVTWSPRAGRCGLTVESPRLVAVTLPGEPIAYSQRVYLPYLHWVRADDPARIFRFEAGTSWSGLYLGLLIWLPESGGYTVKDNILWFGPHPGGRAVLRLTVSRRLSDLFPPTPPAPSRCYATLRKRVLLDSCRDIPFDAEAAQWQELADYGLTDILAIRHAWQRLGYDRGYPVVLPANAEMGGDEGLIRLSRAARGAGWLFALHEMYGATREPELAQELARTATGKTIPFMLDPVTGEQLYEISPSGSVSLARQWSGQIHERYATTAAFLDVHPSVAPWRFARGTAGRSLLADHGAVSELIDVVRDAHGGPVIGEGGLHYLWAGRADGFEAEVAAGRDAPVLPDFALASVAPASVSYGLGYYSRWCRGHPVNAALEYGVIDAYRTRTVAFGHAAYIASEYLCNDLREAVKEYYIVGALQQLYLGVPVEGVSYEFDGHFLPIEEALQRTHYPPRIRVTYANGLAIYANVGTARWHPLPALAPGLALPQDGWIGTRRGRLLAGSADLGQGRTDFFLGEDVALVDARGDRSPEGRSSAPAPAQPARLGVLSTNSCVLLRGPADDRVEARLVYPGAGSFAEITAPERALSLTGVDRARGFVELPDADPRSAGLAGLLLPDHG